MPLWKTPTGYRIQFQFQGQRYSKSGCATKKAAERWANDRLKELEEAMSAPATPQAPLTLSDLMAKYMAIAERGLVKQTLAFRKRNFAMFLAHVGNVPAQEVTPDQVESFLLARPTNNAFNKSRTEIMRLYSWGVRRQLVTSNPVFLVEKLSIEKNRKVIPTPTEMSKILLVAGPDRPLLLVLFHTLARIDEILRLKWQDVNFSKKTVALWTRKRRGGNWESDEMAMNEDLYAVLWGLWQKRSQDEYVFFNSRQQDRYLYRPKLMGSICRRAGVPKFGFHTVRHFVASYMYDVLKVDIQVIQKLLRHKSVRTTEIYLHTIEPRIRETMRLLEGNVLGVLSEPEAVKAATGGCDG